jgi:hypothetical protein
MVTSKPNKLHSASSTRAALAIIADGARGAGLGLPFVHLTSRV